jgi:hypothetical protein
MLRVISRKLAAIRVRSRRLVRDEAGSIVTYMVIVPVLAGAAAIGVETGEFYQLKRGMQSAADAAAIAGAIDRLNGATSSIVTDGKYAAQRNGFTDGVNTVVVTINSPPTSGPNIGTTGAVEAIVTKSQKYSLGGVLFASLGMTNKSYTIRARSVAAQGSYSSTTSGTTTTTTTNSDGCLVALTDQNEQGVNLSNFNNYGSDCSVLSNGTASTNDSKASIYFGPKPSGTSHASFLSVYSRGSFAYDPSVSTTISGVTLVNQSTKVIDPYSGMTVPTLTCDHTNYVEPSGTKLTLLPGTYCGGLSILNKSNVYFEPGTYYIANGDLVITADNNVSCPDCTNSNGTTFVLTQNTGNNSDIGGVVITSENNISLNAGSGNTYPGVLFYQDRNAPLGTMSSTTKIFTIASLNNATLAGAVYFPSNRIDIASINNIGGSPTTGCTIWIGRYIKFSSYNNNYKGGCKNFGTTPAGYQTTTTTATTTTTSSNVAKVLE